MKRQKLLKHKPLKFVFLTIRSLIISAILVATFSKIPIPTTLGWIDSSWEYRKAIAVSNSGGTLTDEDVLVEVDTATLITAGKLQTDCDDLRFTDSDESTTLSYWVEGGCNTSATQVWVRIPSLPNGGKTIYMYYGNASATNAEESWSGVFVLLNTSDCPTGWTRNSDFDNRFIYGAATYGSTGGSSTHNHGQASCTTGGPSATTKTESDSGTYTAATTHIHTNAVVAVDDQSNLPPYLNMLFCSNSELNIDTGLITLFTTTPENWTRFSALDEKFPTGALSYGGTGGAVTHTHTTTGGYTTSAQDNLNEDSSGTSRGAGPHTHLTLNGATEAASSIPPYYDMVFASKESAGYASSGLISITTEAPPLGWTRFTNLDGKFLRGATTSGGTGGTTTHTHSVSIYTDNGNASNRSSGTRVTSAAATSHSHSCSTTTSSASQLPSYIETLFYQRKTSVSTTLGDEITQNTAPYAPSYIQIEGTDGTPVVSDFSPEFSAIFSDADGDDTGNYYQVQVNTSSDFTGTAMWDSTKTAAVPAISNGGRSSEISYAGTELVSGNTYYWRIKFWDSNIYNSESDWSATGQFMMDAAPTALSTNISDESDVYANIPIDIQAIYSDPDGSADLDRLYLKIHNPSASADIEYYITASGSDQTGQYPTSVSGSGYVSAITYDTQYNTPSSTDITVTWHITVNWTWTQSTELSFGIKALDDGGIASEYSSTAASYKYENRLTFIGDLTVEDTQNNTISESTWYPANTAMNVSGVKIVYFGTTDLYPADSQFDVKVVNEELTEWYDTTSSGENISIASATPTISNASDTYTISITSIPGYNNAATLTFNVKTDVDNPVIPPLTSTSHPSDSTWYTAKTGNISWSIEDDLSGIYKSWRLIDQVQDQTIQNISANGTEIDASGTYNFTINQDGTWYVHIASADNVGLSTVRTYKIQIDSQAPVFASVTSTTHPSQTTWYTNKMATVSWQITELGSGIANVWAYPSSHPTEEITTISTEGTEKSSNDSFTMTDLNNGIWYLHLLAQDNTDRTAYTTYTIKIDAQTPDIVDITGNYEGIWQNIDSGPAISWTNPNSVSGDTYYITNNGTEPTSANYAYATTSTTYNLPSQKEGETTIKVRAMNGAGAYSLTRSFVIRYDSVAPTNVSSLKAESSTNGILLSWGNPTDTDLQKVVLIRNANRIPTSVSDGTKLYEGTNNTYLDQVTSNEITYHYAIYAYDTVGNISSGATISSSATTPESTPTDKVIEVANLSTGKQLSVSINNFTPTVLSSNDVHVYSEQTIDIVVPAKTINDEVSNPSQVTLLVGGQTYIMSYDAESDNYTTRITAPSVKGAYDTRIQVSSAMSSNALTLSLSILVDPYGYIYMMSGYNEVRISNAKVSLYTKSGNEEILWTPMSGETNPQYTNQQGEYQFFVQPGEYKLVVEASGYIPVETEWFTVETNIVEKNIEVKKNYVVLYSILALTEIAVGICIGVCLKKKKRKLKSNN